VSRDDFRGPTGPVAPTSEHDVEHRYDAGDPHRRRAAHLMGLIVSGAVLATAPDTFLILRVAFILLGTLAVYWAAETYAHWIASRTVHGRDLTRAERIQLIKDGWPLMAACAVPLAVLLLEALLQVPTERAVNIALLINTGLLFAVGWNMSRAGGLRGVRLVASALVTGLLGIAMVFLKIGLH
jgi:hypothetical protein